MAITVDIDGDGIAVATIDDGAANTFTPERFEQLVEVLDHDARAFVVTGRPGMFSAGLDLTFMRTAGVEGVTRLLTVFGEALMRWWLEPRPTVCAANGHAIAAGTMVAMTCDHAVAQDGEWWWGLTETQIDFAMPSFGITLARANVRNDRIDDLILPGARIPAAAAVEVGYADELAPEDEVLERAVRRATELAALPPRAYGATKQRLRGDAAAAVLDGLADDIAALSMPAG